MFFETEEKGRAALRKSLEESAVYSVLSLIIDVIFAGMLWLLVSLPIITVGPASSALYYAMAKTVRRGRGRLGATFFSAFKSNFKQGTVMWLLYIAYAVIGIVDMYAIRMMGFAEGSVMDHLSKLFFLPALFTLPWIFAFISRFENSVTGSLKFVGYLTLKHIGRTLLLVGLLLLCAVIGWLIPFIAWLLPSVCCLAMTYLIEPVFRKFSEQPENNGIDQWYNE